MADIDVERVRRLAQQILADDDNAIGYERDLARFALDQHERAEAAEKLADTRAAALPVYIAELHRAEERAQRAEAERDRFIGHGCDGNEVNAVALLDLYHERTERAEADAARLRKAWARMPSISWEAGVYAEHGSGPDGEAKLRAVHDVLDVLAALDAQPPTPSAIEVRRDDSGEVDEIVARAADVHLERMDDDAWCLIVSEPGQPTRGVWVSLYRKKREVRANVYEDTRAEET